MSFLLSKYSILQPLFPIRLNEACSLLSKFFQISSVLAILFTAMATCKENRNQLYDPGGVIKTGAIKTAINTAKKTWRCDF